MVSFVPVISVLIRMRSLPALGEVIRSVTHLVPAWPGWPGCRSSLPRAYLRERGWALNVFWLPDHREEGVRRARVKARAGQACSTPGPGVTRWNQMGDCTDRLPEGG